MSAYAQSRGRRLFDQGGLVENRPYWDNFVRTFSARHVNDLYQVRKALEALAVLILSRQDLDQIRAILDSAQRSLEARDAEQTAQLMADHVEGVPKP